MLQNCDTRLRQLCESRSCYSRGSFQFSGFAAFLLYGFEGNELKRSLCLIFVALCAQIPAVLTSAPCSSEAGQQEHWSDTTCTFYCAFLFSFYTTVSNRTTAVTWYNLFSPQTRLHVALNWTWETLYKTTWHGHFTKQRDTDVLQNNVTQTFYKTTWHGLLQNNVTRTFYKTTCHKHVFWCDRRVKNSCTRSLHLHRPTISK
jgi:hypothetical protein